ncbi:MAG: hypothetical protein ABIB43_04880 [archaeon]
MEEYTQEQHGKDSKIYDPYPFIRKIIKTNFILSCAVLTWGFTLATLNYKACRSEKIVDETHLQEIIIEESKALDMKNKDITGRFTEAPFGHGQAIKLDYNKYEIILDKKGRNRGVLKHELYHILKGHAEEKDNLLIYLFIEEPQAALYGAYGIKL